MPLLAARARHGGAAGMAMDGGTDAEGCRASVAHVLGPTLGPGASVMMDHLRAHNVAGRRERREAGGAPLLSLPPSAPDLSPLEPCWATLTPRWRAAQARTRDALDAAIEPAFAAVTRSATRGWFRPGGYAFR